MRKSIIISLLFAICSFVYGQDPLYDRPDRVNSQSKDQPEINLKLDKSLELKTIGSNFQAIGVGLISVAIVVSMREFDETATLDDFDRNRNLVKGLAIGGGVVFTAGIAFNLSGNEKLISVLKR